MAVENHPFFLKWKQRLENLIEAKNAQREGHGSQDEVDRARAEYDKIVDEL